MRLPRSIHRAIGPAFRATLAGPEVVAIARELNLPIRYIGVGEKADDLRPFVAQEFVEALLSRDEAGEAP